MRLVTEMLGQLRRHRPLYQPAREIGEETAGPNDLLLGPPAREQLVDQPIAQPVAHFRRQLGKRGVLRRGRSASGSLRSPSGLAALPAGATRLNGLIHSAADSRRHESPFDSMPTQRIGHFRPRRWFVVARAVCQPRCGGGRRRGDRPRRGADGDRPAMKGASVGEGQGGVARGWPGRVRSEAHGAETAMVRAGGDRRDSLASVLGEVCSRAESEFSTRCARCLGGTASRHRPRETSRAAPRPPFSPPAAVDAQSLPDRGPLCRLPIVRIRPDVKLRHLVRQPTLSGRCSSSVHSPEGKARGRAPLHR